MDGGAVILVFRLLGDHLKRQRLHQNFGFFLRGTVAHHAGQFRNRGCRCILTCGKMHSPHGELAHSSQQKA